METLASIINGFHNMLQPENHLKIMIFMAIMAGLTSTALAFTDLLNALK